MAELASSSARPAGRSPRPARQLAGQLLQRYRGGRHGDTSGRGHGGEGNRLNARAQRRDSLRLREGEQRGDIAVLSCLGPMFVLTQSS